MLFSIIGLLLSHNNFTNNIIAIILSILIKKLEQKKQEILLMIVQLIWITIPESYLSTELNNFYLTLIFKSVCI